MQNNKKIIKWIGLCVVVILVVLLIIKIKPKSLFAPKTASPEIPKDQILIDGSEDIGAGSIDIPTKKGQIVKPMSYQDAISKYKDSKIELSLGDCKASPDKSTFKDGTDVMFDNRSPEERTITLDVSYKVKGYGFKIIKLTNKKLPVTWKMDCGKQIGVASISLTK